MLRSATCYGVLWNATECYEVLENAIECYGLLLNVTCTTRATCDTCTNLTSISLLKCTNFDTIWILISALN